MLFDSPVDFREAIRQLAGRQLMPTSLTSAELAQVNREILRNSMFSAQTTLEGLLDRYKTGVLSIVKPEQVQRPDMPQTVTEGYNPATLRTAIEDYLKSISYKPEEGKEGTLEDISSDGRINLVIDTNVKTGHGAGRFVQQNADPDVVDLWPALEFVRFEERDEPRNWKQRWTIAAQTAGDPKAMLGLASGRMVALKSSGIWQELGNGAGGYMDTLGNPYPPFAFRSGMGVEEVSREEAEALGILEDGEKAKPAAFDLATLFSTSA